MEIWNLCLFCVLTWGLVQSPRHCTQIWIEICSHSTFFFNLFYRYTIFQPNFLKCFNFFQISSFSTQVLWCANQECAENTGGWKHRCDWDDSRISMIQCRQQLAYRWSRKGRLLWQFRSVRYAKDQFSQTHTPTHVKRAFIRLKTVI